MKTIVINLIGSPGTGKSTLASELFSKMKWKGYDVELVSEYAKELVWEERHETFKNELYLFAKQHHRLFRLNNKVKYIITDRPLILSLFYNEKYGDSSTEFKNIVLNKTKNFKNIIFFLQKKKLILKKDKIKKKKLMYFQRELNHMLKKVEIKQKKRVMSFQK